VVIRFRSLQFRLDYYSIAKLEKLEEEEEAKTVRKYLTHSQTVTVFCSWSKLE
jgi:hypothetical protein